MKKAAEKHMPPNSLAEKESNSPTVKVTAYPWKVVLAQFDALSRQRGRQLPSDYQREAEYIGSLFLAISGEPGPDGKLGIYQPEDIVSRIRPYLDIGNGWMAAQGQSSLLSSLLETALRAVVGQGTYWQDPSSSHTALNGPRQKKVRGRKEVPPTNHSQEESRQDEGEPELYLEELNLADAAVV